MSYTLRRPSLAVAILVAATCTRVAAQSSQNLLVSSNGQGTTGQIVRIAPGGGSGSASSYAAMPTGFHPLGLVGDGAGNLFVTAGGSDVYRIAPGGTVSTVATGFIAADGLAIRGGSLYVSDFNAGTVSKVDPTSGSVTPFATGLALPKGLAFDTAGNLYVANTGNDTVQKVGPTGGAPTTFATGYTNPFQLAFDSAGYLYATESTGNLANDGVYRVGPGGGTAARVVSLGDATGLAFDENGDLYVSSDNSVIRYTPSNWNSPSVFAADNSLIQAGGAITFAPVPEPASVLLTCAVAGGLVAVVRRRVRRA